VDEKSSSSNLQRFVNKQEIKPKNAPIKPHIPSSYIPQPKVVKSSPVKNSPSKAKTSISNPKASPLANVSSSKKNAPPSQVPKNPSKPQTLISKVGQVSEKQTSSTGTNSIYKDMVALIESEMLTEKPNVHWADISKLYTLHFFLFSSFSTNYLFFFIYLVGLDEQKKALRNAAEYPLKRPDIFTGLRSPPKGLFIIFFFCFLFSFFHLIN
jgi:SpoVK/Ycf46/Vps4 family AAA+-type ATPase